MNKTIVLDVCKSCLDYIDGYKTLDEVLDAIEKDVDCQGILSYPEKPLGFLLYELSIDFYCWYGHRDDLIDKKIRTVCNHLKTSQRNLQ